MKFFLSLLLLSSFIHLNGMKRGREQNQKQLSACICGKKYKTQGAFKNHKQKNRNNLACNLCNEYFSLTCHFKHHLQSQHKIKLYLCLLCRKDFKHNKSLINHITKIHPTPAVTFLPTPSANPVPIPANPIPVSPMYLSNLISLLHTKNPLYTQPPLDDSLFLEWTHTT